MAVKPPTPTHERAVLASRSNRLGADHPQTREAERDYYAARLEAYAEEIVRSAPPFTEHQKARIAAILASAPTATGAEVAA